MTEITTEHLHANETGLARAAKILRQGGRVAFPTETVYGLGADASQDRAVAGIYEAKGRPSFNPLIVHLAEVEHVKELVVWNETAALLAQAFWPGPLTLVLPLQPGAPVSPLVTAGLPTLAVRIPEAPVARALLKEFGGALAAPSANPSGQISPTCARHVISGLEGRIEGILNGGRCTVGLESTILALTEDGPHLLRPGGIARETLEEALGQSLLSPASEKSDVAPVTAPGQLASHYAPRAKVRLNAQDWNPGEARLGFGAVDCDLNLSKTGDLTEAAAALFRSLHALDARGVETIAVSPVPMEGLGVAINDRLTRAAAEDR